MGLAGIHHVRHLFELPRHKLCAVALGFGHSSVVCLLLHPTHLRCGNLRACQGNKDVSIRISKCFIFSLPLLAAKSLQTLNLFTIQDACARSSAPRSSNEKELMKTWAERFSPTFNERTIVLRINEMCLSSA